MSDDKQIFGAREGHVKETHGVEFGHAFQRFAFSFQVRLHQPLHRLWPSVRVFARVAQHHDGKLQTLGLVDGQKGDAPFWKRILDILVFALTAAEERK